MSFIFLCSLFLLVNAIPANAGTFSAFDSKSFVRGSGKPVIETASFTIKDSNTTYSLKIYNGGTNSEYERVSSAVIKLNGSTIFEESDFNQQAPFSRNRLQFQAATPFQQNSEAPPEAA